MQDFSFAVKEKVVEDHNVIDEAIREEAEVSSAMNCSLRLLTTAGIHRLLHSRWSSISSQFSEGQELENKRLSGQSTLGRCIR